MTPAGVYAVYQGRRYLTSGVGDDYVWIRVSAKELRDLHGSGVLERSDDGPHGPAMKVQRRALDRLLSRRVRARWRGAEVSVHGVRGDLADFYSNAGPVWAAENGVEGDQHDGWWGEAPLAELTQVEEQERDLPLIDDA